LKYAIEDKIRDLFIADSDLNDVQLFFIGEPLFIRTADYPCVIIFVESQVPFTEETGIWVYRYGGYVATETRLTDTYKPKDRKADMDSLLLIRRLLDAASKNLEANLTLNNLIEGDETVRRIITAEKIYSIVNRQDNILNRGDFNFLVETQRPRTL